MENIILGLHVSVCLFLIFVVLLQRGKGADMGAVFGGSTNTILGATGAVSLLQKVTTGAAVIFMLTSLYLAWSSSKASGVLDRARELEIEQIMPGEALEADEQVNEQETEIKPPESVKPKEEEDKTNKKDQNIE